MHPHLARDVGQDEMPVLELDPEHRVGKGLLDRRLHADGLFLDHTTPEKSGDKRGGV